MAAIVYDGDTSTDDVYIHSSSSSGGSSLAPTDFHLSQSFDGASQTIVTVALERCLLCYGSRRSFYCKYCVRSGDFVHSRAASQQPFQQPYMNAERYADKLKRWKALQKEREKIVERFNIVLIKTNRTTQKRTEMLMRRQRIQMMRDALAKLSESVSADRNKLEELQSDSHAVEQQVRHYEHDHVRIVAHMAKMTSCIERHALYHRHTLDELTALRRQHVTDLITFIFPITELPGKSTGCDSTAAAGSSSPAVNAEDSLMSLLADARRMAYVKGRWVYTDSGYEQLYRIVAPSLPGSGDYSMAVMDTREPSSPTAEADSRLECSQTQNITAALSLAAQLVFLLSYYLDVILPRPLKFSEFCASDLTEQSFNRAVLRLNHNVLRLCFAQTGLDLATIDPRNTVVNLLAVLNSPQLGSPDSCQIVDSDETVALMRSIEMNLLGLSISSPDDLIPNPTGGYLPDSESESSDIDECLDAVGGGGAVGGDERVAGWEHVPITLPEVETSSINPRTSLPSYLAESSTAVTSIVSSLWRWGRGSDKT